MCVWCCGNAIHPLGNACIVQQAHRHKSLQQSWQDCLGNPPLPPHLPVTCVCLPPPSCVSRGASTNDAGLYKQLTTLRDLLSDVRGDPQSVTSLKLPIASNVDACGLQVCQGMVVGLGTNCCCYFSCILLVTDSCGESCSFTVCIATSQRCVLRWGCLSFPCHLLLPLCPAHQSDCPLRPDLPEPLSAEEAAEVDDEVCVEGGMKGRGPRLVSCLGVRGCVVSVVLTVPLQQLLSVLLAVAEQSNHTQPIIADATGCCCCLLLLRRSSSAGVSACLGTCRCWRTGCSQRACTCWGRHPATHRWRSIWR